MPGDQPFLLSSIGRKTVMAATGILVTLFLVAHMIGNLLVFAGPDAINEYAAALKAMPVVLWGARLGLIAVFVAHIATAFQLKRGNMIARPVPYQYQNTVQASSASRTMIISGTIVLLYVIYHLSHFTLGLTHPEHFASVDAQGRHDVYRMLVLGFREPLVAYGYIIAMFLIAFHLSHGIASVFQTLGFHNPRHVPLIRKAGGAFSALLFLGFAAIPLAVQFGVIR